MPSRVPAPEGRAGGRGDAPDPVTIAAVVEKTVPLEVTTVGGGEPDTTVEVRAQSNGRLTGVHFTEGADVTAGGSSSPSMRDRSRRPSSRPAVLARDLTTSKNLEATRVRHAGLLKERADGAS